MKTKLFILGLIIFAFVLRFYTLPQNLFYAFEQGRDLEVVKAIAINHKLTLIGPRTSIDGVFHGSFYYYLMAVPFVLSKGNPLGVMAFFILWQSLGAFFIFKFLNRALNQTTALIAAVLYVSSYALIFYSRWFSHPPLIIPFSLLLFWSLWEITKNTKFYFLLLTSWLAIFHLDLVVAVFFLPALVIYFLWQKPLRPSLKIISAALLIAAFFLSPYLLFELRHNFLMANSILKFLSLRHYPLVIIPSLSHFWFRISTEIEDILAPNFPVLSLLVFGVSFFQMVVKRAKTALEKLVLLWVLSIPTLGIFFSPFFGLKHYLVGVVPGLVILISMGLGHLWQGNRRKIAVFLFTILVLNNLYLVLNWLPKNRNVFYLFPQPGMVLSSQLQVLDYIYSERNGKNFGWEAFTLPYFSPAGWQYLFAWYGITKYGYFPKPLKKGEYFYVIIEPGVDSLFLNNWLKQAMDKRGKIVTEETFGTIRVQKRNTVY